jgi:UTP-glucose-1-phosphate uridylyltransferase
VIDVAVATGKSAVSIVGISAEEAKAKGATAIYGGEPRGAEFRITFIPDKGAKSSTFDTKGAALAYTGVGRYCFGSALGKTIDHVEGTLKPGAELDDIPVMQLLLNRGLMTGCLIDGRFLDVGLPTGYTEANAELSA